MCIIVNKPKGVEMPSKEILRNCFTRNSDGAGLMYALNGKVQIHKGFMTFDKFYEYLNKLDKVHELKNHAIIMHFRISTGGNVDAGNCHPYPVVKDEKLLRKEHVTTDLGMAHNGIISMYNIKNGVLNDTQQFIMGCVSTLKGLNEDFLKDKATVGLLGKVAGSRLCFLDGNENVTMIGQFVEDDGIYYSNTSYKSYKSYGYGYGYDYGWESYYKHASKTYDEIVASKKDNKKFNAPLSLTEYNTCLDNLMFLEKGDIVYTKDGEVFEIGSDEKYAIDTFFNLYVVNKIKHDIQLLYEDVDFSYETWTKSK